MLNEVSELTGKVTLLLGRNDVPYDFPKSNALEFVDAQFVRGWRPINLWRTAKTLSKVGPVDVIHDTFGNFLMPFLRASRRRRSWSRSRSFALGRFTTGGPKNPVHHQRPRLGKAGL